ncbi:hypothetical protein Ade02nite_68730 [Paractinoplanes deccanensis]|uniref:DinB-like domain-containing protein n=1 Tax=Paractinoplanes deccanensis TaxID=113561 RepID=A0ABQ3YDZ9_9ACTN|nr:DinB family protein [Actinoplanes deccanensis]GID78232.1 hypothetical protein Ade02nite_68730 [Actinoplanes deccanensis]
MADFEGADLRGSRFKHVNLAGADVWDVDFAGARFRDTNFYDVVMRGVYFGKVDINGEIESLVINGVDVAPYVVAERDRLDPERVKMRPSDPAGFREAWDLVETRWAETVERARRLPAVQLHESVDNEWSFIETLRHLAFASESWVHRAILGDPSPWHPLSLPWDGMPDTPGVPRDRQARPSLDEVLAFRHDRMATVRRVIEQLTDDQLKADTTPVDGPGWPPAGEAFPVRECLLTVLNEEWEHRRYAERDLAILQARTG